MLKTHTYLNTYDTSEEYQKDCTECELEYFHASAAFRSMPSAINFRRLEQAMYNWQHLRLNARESGTGIKAFYNLSRGGA